MLDKHPIDDFFQQGLHDYEVPTSFKAWDAIQETLPLPIPWYKRREFWYSTGLVVCILLGISLGAYHWYPSSPNAITNNIISNQQEFSKNKFVQDNELAYVLDCDIVESVIITAKNNSGDGFKDAKTMHIKKGSFKSKNQQIIVDTKEKLPSNKLTKHLNGKDTVKKSKRFVTQQTNQLLETNSVPANMSVNSATVAPLNTQKLIHISNHVKKEQIVTPLKHDVQPTSTYAKTRGLYLGSFWGANNTWILNPQAIDASITAGNLNYKVNFDSAWGFAGGYDFSAKWGIHAEWIVRFNQGQKFEYERLFHKVYQKNQKVDINLAYTQIPVYLKYKTYRLSPVTKQPVVFNYLAGIQYGALRAAEIQTENPIIQEALTKSHTWGFVAGMDCDVYLTNNYFISLGARSGVSTASNNWHQFNFPNAKTFNNLSFGVRASLNYRFTH